MSIVILLILAGLFVIVVLYREHLRAERFLLAMEDSDRFHHETLRRMYPEAGLKPWEPWEWLHR